MSLTISLLPIAVALVSSLSSSSVGLILAGAKQDGCAISCASLPPVETIYQDGALLEKTLGDQGLRLQKKSENEYLIRTECGTLRYSRNSEGEPFRVEAGRVRDLEQLLHSVQELEQKYGRNVQAFTRDRILQQLHAYDLSLEQEEQLEDETILLTLRVL